MVWLRGGSLDATYQLVDENTVLDYRVSWTIFFIELSICVCGYMNPMNLKPVHCTHKKKSGKELNKISVISHLVSFFMHGFIAYYYIFFF